MPIYPAIALGAALGGLSRHLAGVMVVQGFGLSHPFATAFVNVTGSLLIGLVFALTGPDGRLLVSSTVRQALMTGFLGGYTTFSILSLETLALFYSDTATAAVLNLAGSLTLALLAVWLGYAMGLRINRPRGAINGRFD